MQSFATLPLPLGEDRFTKIHPPTFGRAIKLRTLKESEALKKKYAPEYETRDPNVKAAKHLRQKLGRGYDDSLHGVSIETELDWLKTMVAEAKKEGIDPAILALLAEEHDWSPTGHHNTSAQIGLMGVPLQYALIEKKMSRKDALEPTTNIQLACHYLSELLNRYGVLSWSLMAYLTDEATLYTYLQHKFPYDPGDDPDALKPAGKEHFKFLLDMRPLEQKSLILARKIKEIRLSPDDFQLASTSKKPAHPPQKKGAISGQQQSDEAFWRNLTQHALFDIPLPMEEIVQHTQAYGQVLQQDLKHHFEAQIQAAKGDPKDFQTTLNRQIQRIFPLPDRQEIIRDRARFEEIYYALGQEEPFALTAFLLGTKGIAMIANVLLLEKGKDAEITKTVVNARAEAHHILNRYFQTFPPTPERPLMQLGQSDLNKLFLMVQLYLMDKRFLEAKNPKLSTENPAAILQQLGVGSDKLIDDYSSRFRIPGER